MNEIPKKLPTAAAVQQALRTPIPRDMLQPDGSLDSRALTQLMNMRAPGWSGEIHSLKLMGDQAAVVYRVIIPTTEGPMWREAIGTALLNYQNRDPLAAAEALAFRRACQRAGLVLALEETPVPATKPKLTPRQVPGKPSDSRGIISVRSR